jgi:F420-0:gamma-glutamyl ligase-like protein
VRRAGGRARGEDVLEPFEPGKLREAQYEHLEHEPVVVAALREVGGLERE